MSKLDLLNKSGGKNPNALQVLQGYSLAAKIAHTERKIKEWYDHWNGKVYVSFSGGKDSMVLLHIVRSMYPEVPAVFVDTGLEFPEIREFVKTIENVTWLKPKMTFNKVIENYGYPIISKKVAMGFSRVRNTRSPEVQIPLRLYGGINPSTKRKQAATIAKKWHYLLNAPFKISDYCCEVMKKSPIKSYDRRTNRKPYIGTMAFESDIRRQAYLKHGCNAFAATNPISTPLSIWLEKDVFDYLQKFKVPYSSIYDMGYDRTGCMFCAFGCHIEKESRFERMKETHPKQYEYCMSKLGMDEVLKWYLRKDEIRYP